MVGCEELAVVGVLLSLQLASGYPQAGEYIGLCAALNRTQLYSYHSPPPPQPSATTPVPRQYKVCF